MLSISNGTHVMGILGQEIFVTFVCQTAGFVSVRPERPATDHFDTGFLGFPLS
jgi:hypothetical protein